MNFVRCYSDEHIKELENIHFIVIVGGQSNQKASLTETNTRFDGFIE